MKLEYWMNGPHGLRHLAGNAWRFHERKPTNVRLSMRLKSALRARRLIDPFSLLMAPPRRHPLFDRLLHDARAVQSHEEAHNKEGDYVKSVVFGGLDGTLTSFAIVAGAAGK